jgi:DNA-directed RNA polymerase specialized sigma24 family protein
MLARLKVRDREILERFYYGEQAAEQICSEMHLTPTQFRLYKSRAIARCGDIARRARPRYQSTNPF